MNRPDRLLQCNSVAIAPLMGASSNGAMASDVGGRTHWQETTNNTAEDIHLQLSSSSYAFEDKCPSGIFSVRRAMFLPESEATIDSMCITFDGPTPDALRGHLSLDVGRPR